MVVELAEPQRVDRMFQALADATRRDILARVISAEASVSTLARLYPMSFAAVQKHVAVLEQAGLVVKRRHGREQLVSTEIEGLRLAQRLLDQFEAIWRERTARFDDALTDLD